MPFCRPVFRDAATGRLSAPGLPFRSNASRADALTPPTEPGRPGGSAPGHNSATERNLQPGWSQATGPGSRSAPGVPGVARASGFGEPMPSAGASPPRRSRTAMIGLGLVIAVIGAVTAIVVSSRGELPVATGPARPTAVPPPATPAAAPGATQAAAAAPAPPRATAEPTAPPAPAEPTAAAPPAAQPKITLRLAIEPAGATITLDDERVTGPELEVSRDARQHHLRITAPGYLPDDETVAFDESQRLVVQLKKAPVPGRSKPHKDRPTEPTDRIESQSPYDN